MNNFNDNSEDRSDAEGGVTDMGGFPDSTIPNSQRSLGSDGDYEEKYNQEGDGNVISNMVEGVNNESMEKVKNEEEPDDDDDDDDAKDEGNEGYEEGVTGLDNEITDSEYGMSESLQEMLNKLRRMYTNSVMTGEADRVGFETALNDLETYFLDLEVTFNTKVETIRTSLNILKKEKEMKVNEWIERYEKLQSRWNECMDQLSKLQDEKEELRKQRDFLMCTQKNKGTAQKNILSSVDYKQQQYHFTSKTLTKLLNGITDVIGAERGAIFVYFDPTNELRSISLIQEAGSNSKIQKDIRISSKTGIAGSVFSSGEALNIANAYKDKRFYRGIDQKTGYVTKSLLCYPLLSQTTDSIIGVIQLINKKEQSCFTVEDEARMSEYAYLISYLIDNTKELWHFGTGSQLSNDGGVNNPEGEGESPRTPTLGLHKKKASQVSVKRIGHGQNTQSTATFHMGKKSSSLIPKDVEEYVKKLEQCWRKSVGDSAKWQNEAAQLEEQNKNNLNKIHTLEKRLVEEENLTKELKEKMIRLCKEFKIQKLEWIGHEKDMKKEMQEIQKKSTLHPKDSTSSQNAVANLMLPTPKIRAAPQNNKSLQLPSINKIKPPERHRLALSLSESNKAEGSDREPAEKSASPPASARAAISGRSVFRDIYFDVFSRSPAPMCILTKTLRVWRLNSKFCDLLDCPEEDLIGILFSDICIVDSEALPKLMQFDIIQGLGLHKPKTHSSTAPIAAKPDEKEATGISIGGIEQNRIVYKTSEKNFLRVNVQISQIGQAGQRFQASSSSSSKTIKGPVYLLLFSKLKSLSR